MAVRVKRRERKVVVLRASAVERVAARVKGKERRIVVLRASAVE